MDRWATFDCYGTLIDWNQGIGDVFGRLWPEHDPTVLLDCYHRHERALEADGAPPYRVVLSAGTRLVATELGLDLPDGAEELLPESLPSWPPFPEVPGALARLRADGWRLAILSNVDPDLLAASVVALGTPVDETVTVADAGSYKPAHAHWHTFFARTQASPSRHVHVAASLFHDIAPCAELGLRSVWINRAGRESDLPRLAELANCNDLADVLTTLVPAG